MATPESTCWTVIQAAAAGNAPSREEFARRYGPVIGAYLKARWRLPSCLPDVEDAVQEVFVECFKQNGVLERAERDRPGGFRPFLYGVARNVALRLETQRTRRREQQPPDNMELHDIPDREASLSRVFDRAWAKALLREAARLQHERAQSAGAAACRRVELLRLRFYEGLPIRAIAAQWQMDVLALHREYARARQEFKEALRQVVAFHQEGVPEAVEQECANLLALLG